MLGLSSRKILGGLALLSLTAGCGAPGALSSGAAALPPTPFGILSGGAAPRTDLLTAVWDRISAGRGYIAAADDLLPPTTFQVLDTDHDGRVTAAEFFRPVSREEAASLAPATAPLAQAAFEVLSAGRGYLTAADLTNLGGPDAGIPGDPAVGPLAAGQAPGTLDAAAFQQFYATAAVSGQAGPFQADAIQDGPATTAGNFLLDGYLKIAGLIGARYILHRSRRVYSTDPGSIGLPFQDVDLTTSDGIDIKSWYVPAAKPTTKALVFIHGIGAARDVWLQLPEFKAMHDQGYNLEAIDLRNHGRSGGTITTFALYEDRDVLAAVDFAKSQGNTSIGLVGNSLGAASVIHAAAEADPTVKAVWDDCSFASFDLAVVSVASNLHLPFLNLVAPAIEQTANQEVGADMSGGDPDTWISRIAPRPVYIVHGADDDFIFAENSRINYVAAQNPKTLWLVPGAHHGDSDTTDPQDYVQRMTGFFAQYL